MEALAIIALAMNIWAGAGFPVYDYDPAMMREALRASVEKVNSQSQSPNLFRAYTSSIKRVNFMNENELTMDIDFKIRETECGKEAGDPPSACGFRRGRSVPTASCRSTVQISREQVQNVWVHCHRAFPGSDSSSSEEVSPDLGHGAPWGLVSLPQEKSAGTGPAGQMNQPMRPWGCFRASLSAARVGFPQILLGQCDSETPERERAGGPCQPLGLPRASSSLPAPCCSGLHSSSPKAPQTKSPGFFWSLCPLHRMPSALTGTACVRPTQVWQSACFHHPGCRPPVLGHLGSWSPPASARCPSTWVLAAPLRVLGVRRGPPAPSLIPGRKCWMMALP
uniref:Secreted phosphoprotein 24 n=1 Tax=Sarcophilus harrisii TaxID=9305 RepID=A0A7N4NIS0_SARHA